MVVPFDQKDRDKLKKASLKEERVVVALVGPVSYFGWDPRPLLKVHGRAGL